MPLGHLGSMINHLPVDGSARVNYLRPARQRFAEFIRPAGCGYQQFFAATQSAGTGCASAFTPAISGHNMSTDSSYQDLEQRVFRRIRSLPHSA